MRLTSKNLELLDGLNSQEEQNRYDRVVDYVYDYRPSQADTCTNRSSHKTDCSSIKDVVSGVLINDSRSIDMNASPESTSSENKLPAKPVNSNVSNILPKMKRTKRKVFRRSRKATRKRICKGPTRKELNAQRYQRIEDRRGTRVLEKDRHHRSFHLLEKLTSPNLQISRISMRPKRQDCGLKPGIFNKGKSSSKAAKKIVFSERDFLGQKSETSSISNISKTTAALHGARKREVSYCSKQIDMPSRHGSSKALSEVPGLLQMPSAAENTAAFWRRGNKSLEQNVPPQDMHFETEDASYNRLDTPHRPQVPELSAIQDQNRKTETNQQSCHSGSNHQPKLQLSSDYEHQGHRIQNLGCDGYTLQSIRGHSSDSSKQETLHAKTTNMDRYSAVKTLAPTPLQSTTYENDDRIYQYPATCALDEYDTRPYEAQTASIEANEQALCSDYHAYQQHYTSDLSESYHDFRYFSYQSVDDEEEEMYDTRSSSYKSEYRPSKGLDLGDYEDEISLISFANFWSRRPLR